MENKDRAGLKNKVKKQCKNSGKTPKMLLTKIFACDILVNAYGEGRNVVRNSGGKCQILRSGGKPPDLFFCLPHFKN
jgi:hypothetical protein